MSPGQTPWTAELELIHAHSDSSNLELYGHRTYQLKVQCPDSNFKVIGIYSNDSSPLNITCTESFWQHPFGSAFSWNTNAALIEAFPNLEYDSRLALNSTVGAAPAFNNLHIFLEAFEASGASIELFGPEFDIASIPNSEGGENQLSVFFYDDDIVSSDDNNQIVLGQFTVPSSAQIAGNVNLLVTSPYELWQPVEHVSFSISPNNIPIGCTDFTACNFAFTLECPSETPCFYSTSTVPCDGSCPDNDFDGLCDLIQLNNTQSQLAQINADIQAGDLCGNGTVWSPTQQRCVTLNHCPQDVNSDGHVGIDDILEVLGWFGEDCSTFQSCGLPMEYQGVAYNTVSINGKCWFAENLKCSKYSNLDSIQSNLTPEEWSSTALGATAIYGDSLYGCLDSLGSIENPACFDTENLSKFGRLYNAYAVNDWRGLCPSGWHVSTDDDWKDVEIFLGMTEFEADHSWWRGTNEGFALKSDSSDVVAWDGNNQSGFSAVPAGKLNPDGFSNGFFGGGISCTFWTSTSSMVAYAPAWGTYVTWASHLQAVRHLGGGTGMISRVVWDRSHGASVRCVKDPL